MKNTKKFLKLVSFALMVACLLSAAVLPSFAAIGSDHNTDPYTLNGLRGYCESNFVFNVNTNCILTSEFKVVSGEVGTMTLSLTSYNYNGASGFAYNNPKNTNTEGRQILSDSYTLTASQIDEKSFLDGSYAEISHVIVGKVNCAYYAEWESLSVGWKTVTQTANEGMD